MSRGLGDVYKRQALFEKTEKDARARRQSYVRMQKSFDLEIQERKAAQQSEMEQK